MRATPSHHGLLLLPAFQLTDLQSLMGVFGRTHYVLGCISRSEDGRYVLEDTTGAVPLDLSAADTAAGYYTGKVATHEKQSYEFNKFNTGYNNEGIF